MPDESKTALVTGGLSGIGRAIVERLAGTGHRVLVLDASERSRDDGVPGDEFVGSLPSEAEFHLGDVSEPGDVATAFDTAARRWGGVDVLVNNAGVTAFKSLGDLGVDDFDRVMRTNVRGAFLCARQAITQMRATGTPGAIVNVASNFAFVGATDAVAYCASKGAVVSMTQAMAVEVGPEGIRVNALCPGATATEFNRAHRARPEIAAEWEQMTPLRMGEQGAFLASPAQIAEAALFLATDASSFMTGAALVVDGGWNAK